ncbi:MAG: hypothetical protein KGL12_13625 [Rhodospirillales bacterium]|nr:hypothetical protein [Rhodospirillales bacterium]
MLDDVTFGDPVLDRMAFDRVMRNDVALRDAMDRGVMLRHVPLRHGVHDRAMFHGAMLDGAMRNDMVLGDAMVDDMALGDAVDRRVMSNAGMARDAALGGAARRGMMQGLGMAGLAGMGRDRQETQGSEGRQDGSRQNARGRLKKRQPAEAPLILHRDSILSFRQTRAEVAAGLRPWQPDMPSLSGFAWHFAINPCG